MNERMSESTGEGASGMNRNKLLSLFTYQQDKQLMAVAATLPCL